MGILTQKMKINMKKLTKLTFLLTLIFGVFLLFRDGLNPPEYKDCGVVEKKMTVAHGRSRSDLILLVNFRKTGEKAIEVDATTYMKYETGDRVCFMLQDESKQEMYKLIFLYKLFSVFTLFVWVAYWALMRFLPDDDNKKG
jgi:hypothetical protein